MIFKVPSNPNHSMLKDRFHSIPSTIKVLKVWGSNISPKIFSSSLRKRSNHRKPYTSNFSGRFLFPPPFKLGDKYAELPREKNILFNPVNLTSFTWHYDGLAWILAVKLLMLHRINNSYTVFCRTNLGLVCPVLRQLQRHRQVQ